MPDGGHRINDRVSPALAELRLLTEIRRRRQCRTSLLAWCEEALAPLGQAPAAHHRLLIRELEDVAHGKTRRLMVNMPPGSAKSTYASVLFPAWLLAQRPGTDMIGASNTAQMAEGFSRRVMSLARDYEPTLGYGLERETAEQWETGNRGRYRAAGIGGSIAGTRADCVTGDTKVITYNGLVCIKDVEVGAETGYVLSYDKHGQRPAFRRVLAVVRRRSDTIWRIRSAAGRVVETTANHRFHTGRGWQQAASLCVGDVLLSAVRRDMSEGGGGSREVSANRAHDVLRTDLRDNCVKHSKRNAPKDLSVVQCVNGDASEVPHDMLGGVPEGHLCREGHEESFTAASFASVRVLWAGVYPEVPRRARAVLQQKMQGQGARGRYQGYQQPGLAQWNDGPSEQLAGVGSGQSAGMGPRPTQVRSLPVGQASGYSSYQPEPFGQSAGELDNPLSQVPPQTPCCGTFQTERDTVAVVERIRRSADVYDIQVEGTECFFANGVLVHNCVIIDDPTRSRADAESATVRESQWNWFTGDLRTRLKPDAAIIVVMTRWHPDDLGGRLLDRQPGLWRVVSLPAIAGADDALGRAPGEWLWSDDAYGYSAELKRVHAEYEAAGATRDWAALYQQTPRPADGSLFKVPMISVVDAAPSGGTTVRGWDLAATKQSGTHNPDWTAGVKLQRAPSGQYVVVDVVRLRGGPDEVEAAIVNTAHQDGKAVRVGLPQDPGQAGKTQVLYLTRRLEGFRIESSTETGEKGTRAAPVASQCNVGNLSIVRAGWNAAFIDELAAFPSGQHDDAVDALSRAFSMVGLNRGPIVISPELMNASRRR